MKRSKHLAECHCLRSQLKSFLPHKDRVWFIRRWGPAVSTDIAGAFSLPIHWHFCCCACIRCRVRWRRLWSMTRASSEPWSAAGRRTSTCCVPTPPWPQPTTTVRWMQGQWCAACSLEVTFWASEPVFLTYKGYSHERRLCLVWDQPPVLNLYPHYLLMNVPITNFLPLRILLHVRLARTHILTHAHIVIYYIHIYIYICISTTSNFLIHC